MACHLAVPASLAAFGSLAIARTVTVMQPTERDIIDFKHIYEGDTDETLTMEEAAEATRRLFQYLHLLTEALSKLDEATLARFLAAANLKEQADKPRTAPIPT